GEYIAQRRVRFLDLLHFSLEAARQLVEDVIGIVYELRSVLNETMRAFCPFRKNRTGHREDFATLFRGHPRRDQRSASTRRLDDDRSDAQAGDHAVPHRKVFRKWRSAGRKFGDDQTVALDL